MQPYTGFLLSCYRCDKERDMFICMMDNYLDIEIGCQRLCNEPRKLDKKLSGFYYEKKTQCKRA